MEFLERNFFQTTTAATATSNSSGLSDLLIRDPRYQFVTSGESTDGNKATVTVQFDETLTVSRIALVEHNLKAFTVFYNGNTANTFAMTSTSDTSVSDYASNSETSHFLRCNAVNCTSVSIDMDSTIVANQEKAIGWLLISNPLTTFQGRVPAAQDYQPIIKPKQVVHELSDGSSRSQVVDRKFAANLSLNFASTALRNELRAVFDLHNSFVFVPFGTTTAWDTIIYPVIWANDFEFEAFSDNNSAGGRSGSIRLLETTP